MAGALHVAERGMPTLDRDRMGDRLKAALGVAAFHGLLAYAFLTGLGVERVRALGETLRVFDVIEPAPPPPQVIQPDLLSEEDEGKASPPNRKAQATPVVAPPPAIRIDRPPPIVTSDRPAPTPSGNDPTAGAAAVEGPRTGAGGVGDGTGSGGQGSGSGDGGGGIPARRIGGAIDGARDYPQAARRARIEGSVAVRFTVRTDGRADQCQVIRSSGSAELDATTCRLVERRFRYRPATDEKGRPVPEAVRRTFDWLLPIRD